MTPAPVLDIPKNINQQLESKSPDEILRWGTEIFGDDIAIGTGFGLSGVVLAHLGSTICPNATYFFLDTHLLFPESHALRRKIERRFDIRFRRITAESTSSNGQATLVRKQWETDHDQCCYNRKVAPLRRFLKDKGLWVTGLRRDQAHTRRELPIVVWDPKCGIYKLHPLAVWTSEQVWSFIESHELPYNELHDLGYPSVGCLPCTRPVQDGEDERAGRWSGSNKTECGIHTPMSHLYSPD